MIKAARHPRDPREAIRIHRIHAHRDSLQPGILQRLRHVSQQMAIGGDSDVERMIDFAEFANELHDASAQQRLAAGDTNLRDSQ